MRRLKVWYRPEMNVTDNDSFVRNLEKPTLFVKNCEDVIEVVDSWAPLSVDELSVSHDRRHVERVLSGVENNGYGNNLASVNASLPWECGSFYHAAVGALTEGVTMSPSSGFHHADYLECWNFCTFNGLTIAAILLRSQGLVQRVGVIDFDCHWGNGTDAVIEHLGLDFLEHYGFGKIKRDIRRGVGFDRWLEDLPAVLDEKFQNCDILFYQAGADAHRDDRFDGLLTTPQMTLRDRLVFQYARRTGKPLVWNLAGGYQEPLDKILALHRTTVLECLKVYS